MKEIILNVLKKMRTDYGNNEMIIFAQDSDLQVVADELEVAINGSQLYLVADLELQNFK